MAESNLGSARMLSTNCGREPPCALPLAAFSWSLVGCTRTCALLVLGSGTNHGSVLHRVRSYRPARLNA
jgi:hypothetical protein